MPNKATSKAQFRLFKGIAEGYIPPKGSLTSEKASEMLGGQSSKGLPEHVEKRALGRLVNKVKRAYGGKRWRVK